MARQAAKSKFRLLALDLSLSPGVSVVDVIDRRPLLVFAGSLATDADDDDATRAYMVETFIASAIAINRPFDVAVREDFVGGKNKRATQCVFASWAAADRALHSHGLTVEETAPILSPTRVKMIVTGRGTATKVEVAAAVERYFGMQPGHPWRKGYDDSDACAVGLAYLIQTGRIDEI